MSINMFYGNGVLCLPEAVLEYLADAGGDHLKVLLCLAADRCAAPEVIAAKLDITPKKVAKAIEYWREAGVLKREMSEDASQACASSVPVAPKKGQTPGVRVEDSAAAIPAKTSSAPRYSTEELTALLESRGELTALLDECAGVFGKVFSMHEIGILLGILDYLGVDGEYLLLLLAHCAKLGKKSVRYVEKMALELYDEGITDPKMLQECIKQKEQMAEVEGKIRSLFGINSRALTAKEKKLIGTWLFTYHYDLPIITRAYEMTVDATGNASMPYAGAILDRWAAADLHTLSDIEKADAERAAQGKSTGKPGNSFDTDDFFGAALQRSFGEDFKPNKK